MKDAGASRREVNTVENKGGVNFAGVDAGLSLQNLWADYQTPFVVAPLELRGEDRECATYTVTGNINEAIDVLAENVVLPQMQEGDFVALLNAAGMVRLPRPITACAAASASTCSTERRSSSEGIMSTSNTCLVVGATGPGPGAAVAHRLRKLGCEVRAVVRDDLERPAAPSPIGRRRAPAGRRPPGHDYHHPSVHGRTHGRVHRDGDAARERRRSPADRSRRRPALIAAAEQAGVRRFVYSLVFREHPDSTPPLARAKRACEARLAHSPMESAVLGSP